MSAFCSYNNVTAINTTELLSKFFRYSTQKTLLAKMGGSLCCCFINGFVIIIIELFFMGHIFGSRIFTYFELIQHSWVSLFSVFICITFFIINHKMSLFLNVTLVAVFLNMWAIHGIFFSCWGGSPDLCPVRFGRCCCCCIHG